VGSAPFSFQNVVSTRGGEFFYTPILVSWKVQAVKSWPFNKILVRYFLCIVINNHAWKTQAFDKTGYSMLLVYQRL